MNTNCKEQIRAEIERRLKYTHDWLRGDEKRHPNQTLVSKNYYKMKGDERTLDALLAFIDSQPEEPKDLGTLISEAQIVAKRLIDHQNFYQSLPKELQHKHTDIEWHKILEFIASYAPLDSLSEEPEHPLEILAKKCPQEDIDPKIAQCIADHWWEMLDDEQTPSKKCEKTAESALIKCEEVDLEQAADEYENNHTYQRYDGGGFTPEYNATLAEAFQAGAEWQKEQDQPITGNSLEQEWLRYVDKKKKENRGELPALGDYGWLMIARHFAKWQKEQMMKSAEEGYVNYYEDCGGRLMAEAQVGSPYHIGDKVKIIIVKEEGEQ